VIYSLYIGHIFDSVTAIQAVDNCMMS